MNEMVDASQMRVLAALHVIIRMTEEMKWNKVKPLFPDYQMALDLMARLARIRTKAEFYLLSQLKENKQYVHGHLDI